MNQIVEKLGRSGIGEMSRYAAGVGGDLIRLEVGDIDLPPPQVIREALTEAYEEGYTHYPPFGGYPDLIEAIREKLSRENNLDVNPENICVAAGGTVVLFAVFHSLVNPGDEIISVEPNWSHIALMIPLTHGVMKTVRLRADWGFKLDVEELKDKITARTRILLINTPNNPSGAILDKETALEIARLADKHGILVVSDEEYEKYVYDGNQHLSIASVCENAAIMQSFSKSFAMSGFRVGYLVAPKAVVEQAIKVISYAGGYASSISQRCALKALQKASDFPSRTAKEFERRMHLLADGLDQIPGIRCPRPQGSIYVWPDISQLSRDSVEFARFLVRKAGVVTVGGRAFGESGEGFLRISLGSPLTDLKRALERIQEAVHLSE